MIAQLSYTRSKKSTPKRAVTSQENRLLNAVIARSTDPNPTGYVALWRIDTRRRSRPPDATLARSDRRDLLFDGHSCVGIRPSTRAAGAAFQCQPRGRRRGAQRPLLRRSRRSHPLDALAAACVEPDFRFWLGGLPGPRLRRRRTGSILACLLGRRARHRCRL